jgi:hypothetical protein
MIRSPDSGQMQGRLEGAIAEIGDLLYYCNDIINSGVTALRSIMTKHIMNILVLPLLLPSLRPVEISAIAPSVRFLVLPHALSFCIVFDVSGKLVAGVYVPSLYSSAYW